MASVVVIGAMVLIRRLHADGAGRMVALAFGTAIVMRYVYWRTTSTLPPMSQPENFVPGLMVYLAEMYSVAMLALSLFVVATPLRPRRGSCLERGGNWRAA
jgi:cellulose synthase (UDP-forming)